jgi:hypothetical protein
VCYDVAARGASAEGTSGIISPPIVMIRTILLSFVALLFLSCAIPMFDKAAIEPGFSGGIGAGAAGGHMPSFDQDNPVTPANYRAFAAGGFLHYGWSESHESGLELAGGLLEKDRGYAPTPSSGPAPIQARLYHKFALGRSNALKVGFGYPLILDLCWLHDFGRHWTTVVDLAPTNLALGAVWHQSLGGNCQGHLAIGVNAPYFAAHLGYAVDWAERKSGR